MSNPFLLSVVTMVLLFAPLPTFAGVVFTELMYDVPGSDTGREWMEIRNTGTEPLDMTGSKFFENNVSHKLIPLKDSVIPAEGYAVIVSNTEKFLADWPEFSGVLFKSSFSLSNTGETLALKDASSVAVASVSYTAPAAEGDGNSLNILEGAWIARKPTPGDALSSETTPPPPKKSSSKRNSAAPGKVSTHDSAEPSLGQLGAVSNTATAGLATSGSQPFTEIFPWVVALVSVIGIAGAAIFFGKKRGGGSGYTITEDKS